MSEIRLEDPELVEVKDVQQNGNVYLSGDLANKTVRVAVEIINND